MSIGVDALRNRIKHRIRQHLPPGLRYDTEADGRANALMDLPVPSDDELIAMQRSGELPSDEELARDERH